MYSRHVNILVVSNTKLTRVFFYMLQHTENNICRFSTLCSSSQGKRSDLAEGMLKEQIHMLKEPVWNWLGKSKI